MPSLDLTNSVGILATICLVTLTSVSSHRGPHHPRGRTISHEEHSHHHHYVPHRATEGQHDQPPEVLTHDKNLLHDKEHMVEDMGGWIFADGRDPTAAEEMEFHYFKMHDFDSNSKLDGLEIFQALSHVLPATALKAGDFPDAHNQGKSGSPKEVPVAGKLKEVDFDYYISLIDKVLEEDDVDGDGYLSYAEYVHGRRHDMEEESERLKTETEKLPRS